MIENINARFGIGLAMIRHIKPSRPEVVLRR